MWLVFLKVSWLKHYEFLFLTIRAVCFTHSIFGFINVKCKVHPRTSHEGPEGKQRYSSIPSLTSTLDAGGWSTSRPGLFTPREINAAPIIWEAGWALGPVWTGPGNLDSTVIRVPDRPARGSRYTDWCIPIHFFVKLLIMTSLIMK